MVPPLHRRGRRGEPTIAAGLGGARATRAALGQNASKRTTPTKSRITSITAKDDDVEAADVSRRNLLVAKSIFTVGEIFVFPWATEAATRPPSEAYDNLVPFSPPWLRSILYAESDPESKAAAKEALLRGEALFDAGDFNGAIAQLSQVPTLGPLEYKMCQRAALKLSKAYKAGGDQATGVELAGREWWWGRGVRWPGWYIVAYLSARSVWFDTKQYQAMRGGGQSAQTRVNAAAALVDKRGVVKQGDFGSFSVTEGLCILFPYWIGLLYVLVTYGLPDY